MDYEFVVCAHQMDCTKAKVVYHRASGELKSCDAECKLARGCKKRRELRRAERLARKLRASGKRAG
jgi:hypothetical protein